MTPNSTLRVTFMAKPLLLCAVLVQSALVWSQGLGTLQLSDQKVSEGFITLSWNDLGEPQSVTLEPQSVTLEPQSVTLQVATDSEFNQLIRNIKLKGQTQVHLSGFEDGIYIARLLKGNVALTQPARFEVQHRALSDAVLLFAIGAVLFMLLVVTLLRYSRPQS